MFLSPSPPPPHPLQWRHISRHFSVWHQTPYTGRTDFKVTRLEVKGWTTLNMERYPSLDIFNTFYLFIQYIVEKFPLSILVLLHVEHFYFVVFNDTCMHNYTNVYVSLMSIKKFFPSCICVYCLFTCMIKQSSYCPLRALSW